jgi:hypothetical protein
MRAKFRSYIGLMYEQWLELQVLDGSLAVALLSASDKQIPPDSLRLDSSDETRSAPYNILLPVLAVVRVTSCARISPFDRFT